MVENPEVRQKWEKIAQKYNPTNSLDLAKFAGYKKGGSLSYWEDYYSGCDVGVFIGSTWVDDIVTIQYSETNNKSPMYGYMSEMYDAVAAGTRVVQGQFAIAFRKVGYLIDILNNYSEENKQSIAKSSDYWREYHRIQEKKARAENLTESEKKFNNRDTKPADRYSYVSNTLDSQSHGEYIKSEGFNIIVTFGDIQGEIRSGTYEVIEGVHITSKSIICEPGGDPIAEMYSFFGRSINTSNPNFNFQTQNSPDPTDLINQVSQANNSLPVQSVSSESMDVVDDDVVLATAEDTYNIVENS